MYLVIDSFDGVSAGTDVHEVRLVTVYVPRAAAIHDQSKGYSEHGEASGAFALASARLPIIKESTASHCRQIWEESSVLRRTRLDRRWRLASKATLPPDRQRVAQRSTCFGSSCKEARYVAAYKCQAGEIDGKPNGDTDGAMETRSAS